MPRERHLTRTRILAAAARLLYVQGVAAVKMESVAAEAGVTKQTLYDHFPSKDEMIAAALDARVETVLALYRDWAKPADGAASVRDRVQAMLHNIVAYASTGAWSGCGFQRAAAELAPMRGHPGADGPRRAKQEIEDWLRSELAHEGWPDAALRARQLIVVMEGLLALMLVHRTKAHASGAQALIDLILPVEAQPATLNCQEMLTVL
jgi:AcrR family transcriptional regulator